MPQAIRKALNNFFFAIWLSDLFLVKYLIIKITSVW
jgi:hypothetical protein